MLDSQRTNENIAIEAQKAMGKNKKPYRPIDENDPLNQLRESRNPDIVPRVAEKDKDKRKPLVHYREKRVPDMNPRKLLEKRSVEKSTRSYIEKGIQDHGHKGRTVENFFITGEDGKPYKALEEEDKPNAEQAQRPRIAVLGGFDMESYLAAQRMLEGQGDPMKRFQFNQVASDATPPDRYLKDYRLPG